MLITTMDESDYPSCLLRSNAKTLQSTINCAVAPNDAQGIQNGNHHPYSRGGCLRRPGRGQLIKTSKSQKPKSPKPKNPLRASAVNCVAWGTLNPRLRASLRVHDGAETPSTIRLKQASTIAVIRTTPTHAGAARAALALAEFHGAGSAQIPGKAIPAAKAKIPACLWRTAWIRQISFIWCD